jgi:hypothetical protein
MDSEANVSSVDPQSWKSLRSTCLPRQRAERRCLTLYIPRRLSRYFGRPQLTIHTCIFSLIPLHVIPLTHNREVEREAHYEKDSLLLRDVRKRLSPKDKKYLEALSVSELQDVFRSYLPKAAERQNNVNNSARRTVRAVNSTTKFLNNFHDYIQAYSGATQIMNAAGTGYGDAAYGALSIFLVVRFLCPTGRTVPDDV